ncbi:DinB family protein [Leptobacterium flavescens]|uniref:DinB family protein n=1 Tax=Leptobacterium flavescens TaxID=472055 RepID=A0A6P0USQ8_9FLAO|nr:DinB family protein [Leptobacterium flavescens]NER15018.1 DinB family protein [Leptobacterium flavescens]
MKRTKWFERKFARIEDNGLLPTIIERLEGTPARLSHKLKEVKEDTGSSTPEQWSIKKEIGHLIDLEPLWMGRMEQICSGEKELVGADLENTRTHQTDHDKRTIPDLIDEFSSSRAEIVSFLRKLKEVDLDKVALHPRLGTPMKMTDLAYFVAEHDDHHLAQITFLLQKA